MTDRKDEIIRKIRDCALTIFSLNDEKGEATHIGIASEMDTEIKKLLEEYAQIRYAELTREKIEKLKKRMYERRQQKINLQKEYQERGNEVEASIVHSAILESYVIEKEIDEVFEV